VGTPMKAVTIRVDQSGLEGLLRRVKAAQQSGFESFDLCIQNPQLPLGRIVNVLRDHRVSLVSLRLTQPRREAAVLRRPGYGKIGAQDAEIARRSAEMVIETALALAPLKPQFLVVECGYANIPGLSEKHAELDAMLDCASRVDTRTMRRVVQVDRALIETQLAGLCRGLHRIARELAPLPVCLLTPGSPYGLAQPDEMQMVFEDLPKVGYWHSTCNAALVHKLGGPKDQVWIERFATRLKGVYLADMLGAHGEQPPGVGEVDFAALAPELSRNTVRVLVVDDEKGGKLRFGSDHLARVGIF